MTDILEQEIARGNRANELLNDALLAEAFQAIRDQCYADWKSSHDKEIEKREDIYKILKVVTRVEGYLHGYLTQGIVSTAKIKQME